MKKTYQILFFILMITGTIGTLQLQAQAPLGANSATYAPITFYPENPYQGEGLIGNYFASSETATIHDPTGKNQTQYTFINVTQGSEFSPPAGKVYIGSYIQPGPSNGTISSHVVMQINLYGIEKK
jgi:hypothetical protein